MDERDPWVGAPCREIGTFSFFPEDSPADQREEITVRAKAVCAACPFRQSCLDFALQVERGLSRDYRFGIFGGLTPRERWHVSLQHDHVPFVVDQETYRYIHEERLRGRSWASLAEELGIPGHHVLRAERQWSQYFVDFRKSS